MMVHIIGWLVQRELVRRWLLSDRREEYGHLYNTDGAVYMGRWVLVKQGSWASKALAFVTQGQYDHARIHWISKPDMDREKHDHPFNYRTWPIVGWYLEEYIDAKLGVLMNGPSLRAWQGSSRSLSPDAERVSTSYRVMSPGKSARAPLGQFHRIATVSDGGVFTLFMMGADTGKWGFLVGGRWMASRDFFKLRGIKNDGKAA